MLSEPNQGPKIAKVERWICGRKRQSCSCYLNVGRLLPRSLESARRGFSESCSAYATHVVAERRYFDIKELHLGHLAKAFALRERPSGMKVPGLRTGAGRDGGKGVAKAKRTESRQTMKVGGSTKNGFGCSLVLAKRRKKAAKMRKAVRAREKFMRGAGVADEFNLG